jgi:hypothetical protein
LIPIFDLASRARISFSISVADLAGAAPVFARAGLAFAVRSEGAAAAGLGDVAGGSRGAAGRQDRWNHGQKQWIAHIILSPTASA